MRYQLSAVEGRASEATEAANRLASDLSLAGMFLWHAKLTPGARICFSFELPSGEIAVKAKVVHNQHRIDAAGIARPGAGVRFEEISERDRDRLESFLAGKSTGHTPISGDSAPLAVEPRRLAL